MTLPRNKGRLPWGPPCPTLRNHNRPDKNTKENLHNAGERAKETNENNPIKNNKKTRNPCWSKRENERHTLGGGVVTVIRSRVGRLVHLGGGSFAVRIGKTEGTHAESHHDVLREDRDHDKTHCWAMRGGGRGSSHSCGPKPGSVSWASRGARSPKMVCPPGLEK